jgi:hypothetical protein
MNTENCYNPLDVFSSRELFAKTMCYPGGDYTLPKCKRLTVCPAGSYAVIRDLGNGHLQNMLDCGFHFMCSTV